MLQKLTFYYTFLFALTILNTYVFAANIEKMALYKKYTRKYLFYDVTIKGKIERGDFLKLSNLLDETHKSQHGIRIVWLSSKGGDVLEAMRIGRLIRQNHIWTYAPSPYLIFKDNDTCDSACFLIWAAGVDRLGDRLGIHRPYFEKEHFKGLSGSEAKAKYNEMSNIVRKYLKDMDVPTNVIEKMFRYSSEDIYYLDKETIDSISKAPFYDEWIIANCGDFTKEELDELDDLEHRAFLSKYPERKDRELSNAEKYYLKYLKNKQKNFIKCRDNKTIEVQLKQK